MSELFDDNDHMRRIADDDQQALGALYDQYGRAIYSLAYHVLQDATLAEEVTQDTFLKVWAQTTHWNADKGRLKSWLLAITHYTAIDRLRREQRRPALFPEAIEDSEATIASARAEPDWQEGAVLRALIRQLPNDQVVLVELAFFQGLSHAEIAETTGLPLGTVKTRLRTALQRLRESWQETASRSTRSAPG